MAIVKKQEEVAQQLVKMDFVKGVKIQWLVDKNVGAKNFAMRRFVIAPGGEVGLHNHPYEHEVYVLAGQGEVLSEHGNKAVEANSFAYVPPDERHGFKNTSLSEAFVFLCMIPNQE
jgi:quercetin dioxygenase-like cupin family protein